LVQSTDEDRTGATEGPFPAHYLLPTLSSRLSALLLLTPLLNTLAVSLSSFAILLLMTAMQSLDQEQKEAARLDGAGAIAIFWHLTLPHLARPIAVVVMIETIFLLSVFAEIFTTTNGGPGYASTNLAYLIYNQALVQFDVGMASAGGLIAVVIANIAAIILV
ncbi:sugar ABC transporter permease, partial [Leclercia adecarboxylata]|uniref:carbohydrate ABC transporter permease n=1 Tax=Leclercia adecarboxylata TaxID=83655 RepID=UPI00234D2C39